MLNLTLFVEGLFKFGGLMLGVFLLWQLVSKSAKGQGMWSRVFGLLVLAVMAVAYKYPNLLGE